MRAVFVAGLVALLCPAATAAAIAQTATAAPVATTATSPAPRRGGDITRDAYIERAKEAAARRFDAMDTNHRGILTADERRAYRAAHSRRRQRRATAAAAPEAPTAAKSSQ